MRIDLRLQGTQLHAGRKLVLALELKACKLRGNEVGKARGKRRLAHIDAAQTGIIQLERAHAMPAHGKRCDNTGAQARKVAARLGRGIAREHALLTAVDHIERGPQHHRGARGAFAESSPQLANTCLPSVKQMAEAIVSDRMIFEAPRAASGVRPRDV